MEREEIQKRLKKELDKNRYEHTLGVMYTAGSLAMALDHLLDLFIHAGTVINTGKHVRNRSFLQKSKMRLKVMLNSDF